MELRTRPALNQAIHAHGRSAMQDAGDGFQGDSCSPSGVQPAAWRDDRIGEAERYSTTPTEREGNHAGRRVIHASDDGDRFGRGSVHCVPDNGVGSPGWEPTGTARATIQKTPSSLASLHDNSAKSVATEVGFGSPSLILVPFGASALRLMGKLSRPRS